jgi:deoxyribonuclease V
MTIWGWPESEPALLDLQRRLGETAASTRDADAWSAPGRPAIAGCFVAYARGEAGPGHPGDRAWAAAIVWTLPASDRPRRSGDVLRGAVAERGVRRASDVGTQAVVADRVPAAYTPGLLAAREGPILAAAVGALGRRPDVLLVDATGFDHPRRAGLATHLGAALDVATVGVTHRSLVGGGAFPPLRRGETSPVTLGGEEVGRWVCTRTGARPVLAHAAWRTTPQTAVDVVLLSSTEAARTPIPLLEARRVAREARAAAGAG